MKMKTQTYIIVLCSLLSIGTKAFAQAKYLPGYVILLTGDTLRGEIKKNTKRDYDNFVKVAYRKSEGNDLRTFAPKKIKGYWVDSTTFVSRMIEEDLVFVKRLSSDTSSTIIYEAQVQYEQVGEVKVATDYYYEKPTKEFVKIKSKKALKYIEETRLKHKKIEFVDLGIK